MDFIIDNIVWIIVGLIIIIMTIIGYIAEKTDFGKKELTKREKKAKEPKVKQKKMELEETELEPVLSDAPLEVEKGKKSKKEQSEEKTIFERFDSLDQDLNAPLGDQKPEPKSIVPPKPINEDLNAPLATPKMEPKPVVPVKAIEEDLNAPLGLKPAEKPTLHVDDSLMEPLPKEPTKTIVPPKPTFHDDLAMPFPEKAHPIESKKEEISKPLTEELPVREEIEEPLPRELDSKPVTPIEEPVLPDIHTLKEEPVANDDDDIWKF